MAGDWIKMRTNLWDDPRVSGICDATGSKEATIVGALYWLWATGDAHSEDGAMPRMSLASIDRKTGVKGFAAALIGVGWLEEVDGGVSIVRFDEHNGASAKRRSVDAQRKANVRTVSASDADILRTASGQITPNLGAREEKRREEKSKEAEPSGSGAGAPAGAADLVFGLGVPLLMAAGVSEPNSRSFLGAMRKTLKDDSAVVHLLNRCAEEKPLQPVAWLQAAMKAKPQDREEKTRATNSAANAEAKRLLGMAHA